MLLVSYAMWPLSFLLDLSYSLVLQRNNDNTPTNWGCALTAEAEHENVSQIQHHYSCQHRFFCVIVNPRSDRSRHDYDSTKKLHLLLQAWVLVQDCNTKFPRSRKSTKSCVLGTKICISWRLMMDVTRSTWWSMAMQSISTSRNVTVVAI